MLGKTLSQIYQGQQRGKALAVMLLCCHVVEGYITTPYQCENTAVRQCIT